jgi:uncharacterized protein YdaL
MSRTCPEARRFAVLIAGLTAACALTLALFASSLAHAGTAPTQPEHVPVATRAVPLVGPAGAPGGKLKLSVARGQGVGPAPKKGSRPKKKRAAKARAAQTADLGALILYDSTGPYAWLGQSYATMVANLASHFGSWTAKPVASYAAGDVNRYRATIYIGSTYDEALPASFLADVPTSTKPVVWIYDNIWRLTAATPDFQSRYGWMWWQFSSCSSCGGNQSPVARIDYKGQSLARNTLNDGGIMDYSVVDPAKASVLATAVRNDGTSFPWAIRSGNLTYIGENPFSYFSEGDRMMAFADLLFDALAPSTPVRHRALLRLEDITPESDPDELRAIADYLSAKKIPFGFGVSPLYKDPKGTYNGGKALTRKLKDAPELVSALKYLQSKGGVMVEHGYTHQYSNVPNPYNGVSGDDFEFYRTVENADHTLWFQGPVKEDSTKWALGRVEDAGKEFTAAKLAIPTIFEFPHYAGSVVDYKAIATKFTTRWERSLYPLGVLTGGTPDYTRVTGQLFPYAVRDVYGSRVLPENLGNVEPEPFYQYPVRFPADIIRDAQRNLVVRDGFASMYFHPFWNIQYLKDTVEGIQQLGYTFVSPESV